MEGLKYKIKKDQISFFVDCSVYPPEAINNAAFVFTDKMHVFLGKKKDSKVPVTMKAKKNISVKEAARAVGEFYNELLNQVVRLQLVLHNKQIREFVAGSAMLGAVGEKIALPAGEGSSDAAGQEKFDALLEKEMKLLGEDGKFEADPFEISAPWKSKRPKSKKKK